MELIKVDLIAHDKTFVDGKVVILVLYVKFPRLVIFQAYYLVSIITLVYPPPKAVVWAMATPLPK